MEEEKNKNAAKLYVKFKIPETLKEFLITFFFDDRKFKDEFEYRQYYSYETYSDEKCTQVQCYAGKMRSFDDLIILANTYYPNTDEKTLMLEIMNLDYRGRYGLIYPMFYYCSDIHKSTLKFINYVYEEILLDRKYVQDSKYYWDELLLLVGIDITKKNDLKNYLTKKQLQNV
jgi:hypothetical protein